MKQIPQVRLNKENAQAVATFIDGTMIKATTVANEAIRLGLPLIQKTVLSELPRKKTK